MRLEGQRVGRYYLAHLLGSGGMGEVYLAEDPRIDQQVAIKVVRTEATPYPDIGSSKESTENFLREVRAIAKLDHPNILPLFDYGEEHIGEMKIAYIVMPFRKEGSLAAWLRQRSSGELLSPKDMSFFLHQATEALQHAHEHSIIHQDVKPSNFLLRAKKENPNYPDLLLADFGIAKFYSATSNASGTIRGTPVYMAPEQWRAQPVFASDQYALAIMTYQLITGRPPFQGSMEQIMYKHLHEQPAPPSTINPRIPPTIDAVLLRALAKRPQDRFSSVAAFAYAFEQAVQTADLRPTPIPPPPPPLPLPPDQSQTVLRPNPLTPIPPEASRSDLRATLAISEQEAAVGTIRTLTLPRGKRVSVPIPAGVYDGQIIRLEGQSEADSPGMPAGALVITIAIASLEDLAPPSNHGSSEERTYLATPSHLLDDAERTRLARPTRYPATTSVDNLNRITPPPPPPPPAFSPAPQRRKITRGKAILLILLVLLVVAASIGLVSYITINNQIATSHANATATADQATAAVNRATAVAATATASWFPYPPNTGKLSLSDPLSDNSKGYNWVRGYPQKPGADCAFTAGAYHVLELNSGSFYYCIANNTNFSNFVFQVQMTFLKGKAGFGGILFRSQDQRHYFFRIGEDGTYKLELIENDSNISPLAYNTFSAIYTNLNQPNTLAVVVNGSNVDMYVNQVFIKRVNIKGVDTKGVNVNYYSQGQIGLAAEDEDNPVEVAFTDAKVWAL